MKTLLLLFAVLMISLNQVKANDKPLIEKKTAESVLEFAANIEELTAENIQMIKNEIVQLNKIQRIRLATISMKQVSNAKKSGEMMSAKPGLYVLAIFLPPIAVGIHTDWDMPTVFNLCWTILGFAPGVIHAFVVLSR